MFSNLLHTKDCLYELNSRFLPSLAVLCFVNKCSLFLESEDTIFGGDSDSSCSTIFFKSNSGCRISVFLLPEILSLGSSIFVLEKLEKL